MTTFYYSKLTNFTAHSSQLTAHSSHLNSPESPMAEIILFHHVQGLTPGVVAFADELRRAGHTVHTPDLFEGRTFPSIDDGMAFAREVGFVLGSRLDCGASRAPTPARQGVFFAAAFFQAAADFDQELVADGVTEGVVNCL